MTAPALPTLAEFYSTLERLDWFYAMSDDASVERAGARRMSEVNDIAARSPELAALMAEYRAHIWAGKPKPAHPDAKKPKAPARRRKVKP